MRFFKGIGKRLMVIIISLLIITSLLLGLAGCAEANLILYDEDIPETVTADINQQLSVFFKGITDQDISLIQTISYVDRLETNESFIGFVDELNSILGDEAILPFQRAYSDYTDYTITIPVPRDGDYNVRYPVNKDDAYSVYYQLEYGTYTYWLMINFVDEKDQWHISRVHMSEIAYNGMGAKEWFEAAQAYELKGQILQACFSAFLAQKLASPMVDLNIDGHKEIKAYYEALKARFDDEYVTPIMVETEDYMLELYGFDIIFIEGQVYTQVKYVTEEAVSDGNAMIHQKEGEMIHQYVMDWLGMFDIGVSDQIMYSAYNEIPNNPDGAYETFNTYIDVITD